MLSRSRLGRLRAPGAIRRDHQRSPTSLVTPLTAMRESLNGDAYSRAGDPGASQLDRSLTLSDAVRKDKVDLVAVHRARIFTCVKYVERASVYQHLNR